jgi:hypothetical protein
MLLIRDVDLGGGSFRGPVVPHVGCDADDGHRLHGPAIPAAENLSSHRVFMGERLLRKRLADDGYGGRLKGVALIEIPLTCSEL